MTSLPAFDTHFYYQELIKAGFSPDQADAQTRLQSEVLSSLITGKLATKEDVTSLKIEMKNDVSRLESKITSTDFKLTWLLGLTGIFGGIYTLSHVVQNFCHLH
jgi:hypothetical protein